MTDASGAAGDPPGTRRAGRRSLSVASRQARKDISHTKGADVSGDVVHP